MCQMRYFTSRQTDEMFGGQRVLDGNVTIGEHNLVGRGCHFALLHCFAIAKPLSRWSSPGIRFTFTHKYD